MVGVVKTVRIYGIEIVMEQKNIYKIAYNSIHMIERPRYLCKNSSGILHDIPNPKFTRLETYKPC